MVRVIFPGCRNVDALVTWRKTGGIQRRCGGRLVAGSRQRATLLPADHIPLVETFRKEFHDTLTANLEDSGEHRALGVWIVFGHQRIRRGRERQVRHPGAVADQLDGPVDHILGQHAEFGIRLRIVQQDLGIPDVCPVGGAGGSVLMAAVRNTLDDAISIQRTGEVCGFHGALHRRIQITEVAWSVDGLGHAGISPLELLVVFFCGPAAPLLDRLAVRAKIMVDKTPCRTVSFVFQVKLEPVTYGQGDVVVLGEDCLRVAL